MIQLLKENKRIINIDESWIAEIDYSRKMWCPSKAPCTVSEKSIGIRHSFIVALDTDGHVYYALTHANTDSDFILSFIRRLTIVLNNESPDWKENSIILLDGAKYHTKPQKPESMYKYIS